MRRTYWLAWLPLIIALLYLLVPLYATFQFSLQEKRGILSLTAYMNVFQTPEFISSFLFSLRTALLTMVLSTVLIVPTAYWVRLKLPGLKPVIEFCTLLPFVIPPVVLVFGLIRAFNHTSLTNSSDGIYVIMVGAYIMLSLPYMFRAVDTGLQSINVRVLTEAAQSLGAGWFTILFQVIFPNLVVAILNGAFITFAIVMGEFTIANLLSQPAFGPYMFNLSSRKVYEPSAVAIISFALTWACILLIGLLGRGKGGTRVTTIR